jgi:O-acetylserine/cysteine efflux transporter
LALRAQDIGLGIAVALIWGMGVVFAKAAIEHFPPILLMALRFAVTAAALVWFVRPPWAQMVRIFWIALVSAAIQYSLTFNGLRGLNASTAVLVLQLEVPFIVVLGAVLLKERPGLRKWLGIGFAFLGVGFIAGEPNLGSASVSLALVISGAFVWAIGQIMVRRLVDLDGVTLIAWVAVFATPQLFALSYVIEGAPVPHIRTADWIVWGTVVYLGLIMTALGYTMWYTLIRRHPVGQVAPFLLLLPVFSVIGGITLLGEQLTLRIALGGAVVIAGVAFILFERAPAAADQTQAPARADDTETLPPRKPGLRTSPADRPGG